MHDIDMLQLIRSVMLFLSFTIKQMCLSMWPSLVRSGASLLIEPPVLASSQPQHRAAAVKHSVCVESYFTLNLLDSTLWELVNHCGVHVHPRLRRLRFIVLNWLKMKAVLLPDTLIINLFKSGYSSSLRNNRIISFSSASKFQIEI